MVIHFSGAEDVSRYLSRALDAAQISAQFREDGNVMDAGRFNGAAEAFSTAAVINSSFLEFIDTYENQIVTPQNNAFLQIDNKDKKVSLTEIVSRSGLHDFNIRKSAILQGFKDFTLHLSSRVTNSSENSEKIQGMLEKLRKYLPQN